ncbi:hypothetical protein PVT68_17545 [Microbulbifer bruguierae]|uniref:Cytochrome c assembly protein domain-containing protein n=1 Tax=Microbulbifer bruguierae TaxID=3029061 RepID=A0ABY8NCA5_9GAMM|nr:hypothetical protein [Microbulbifer bruguierae]WGL16553.1 hypothetical protein PVT68_17545 [Microbulbifer bruguierae]
MGLIFASLLSSAGVLGLYGSWRNWSLLQRWGTLAGWSLLLLSGFLWAGSAASIELGLCYALLALTACAWLLVGYNREQRPQRPSALAAGKLRWPTLPTLGKHLLLLLAAVPLAGAAALYGSTALATALPWQQGNALSFAMLLAPVLWGCGAYWQCADSRPLRPAAVHFVVLIASAVALF